MNVSLETLRDAILSTGLKGPWGLMPVAIWFVDREAEYMDVLKTYSTDLKVLGAPIRPKGPLTHRLFGVPLLTFTSQGAAERNLLRPVFCSSPGVWLEMSDGQHIQLDKEEG